MAWLVKSRGRLLDLRDGPDGPLYVVDDKRWYPLEHLPTGVGVRSPAESDSDALYREADDVSGYEKAPLRQSWLDGQIAKHEAVTAEAAKEAAEREASDETPKKRRSRMR